MIWIHSDGFDRKKLYRVPYVSEILTARGAQGESSHMPLPPAYAATVEADMIRSLYRRHFSLTKITNIYISHHPREALTLDMFAGTVRLGVRRLGLLVLSRARRSPS